MTWTRPAHGWVLGHGAGLEAARHRFRPAVGTAMASSLIRPWHLGQARTSTHGKLAVWIMPQPSKPGPAVFGAALLEQP